MRQVKYTDTVPTNTCGETEVECIKAAGTPSPSCQYHRQSSVHLRVLSH